VIALTPGLTPLLFARSALDLLFPDAALARASLQKENTIVVDTNSPRTSLFDTCFLSFSDVPVDSSFPFLESFLCFAHVLSIV